VVTPILIGGKEIEKMGISREDHIWRQIVWVGEDQCLRPMLAPNLYVIMEKLSAIGKPVRIFEVGQCFRRDTRGPLHLEEFTMMNMVELAPPDDPKGRLLDYIETVMKAVGLEYVIEPESSEVYGETYDVRVKGVEVASAAIGPNRWIAIGGRRCLAGRWLWTERLAMFAGGHNSVARVSRSLFYLDGSKLNVK
jgi:phenylalanyl-tRNA synthetase alpha chain